MPPVGSDPPAPDQVDSRPPRRWRPVIGVFAAVAVAAALIAVAWNLDRGGRDDGRRRIDPSLVTDLVEPEPLTDEERASLEGGDAAGELSSPSGVALAEGGWIEVADETGRLKQRYAADRMDPLPDGWVEMVAPRAVVFGRKGQVTALEGGFGKARLPDREIESGTLREDVRIRFFRQEGERRVSIDADEPWLVIEADAADFDGAEGRIRCDGPVSIRSSELEFAGVNLLVLLKPDGREIEQLVVERATSPLRLRPGARRRADVAAESTPAGVADESTPPGVADGSTADPEEDQAPSQATPSRGANPAAAPAPTFMRLVLDGGVDILRVEAGRRLSIEGDRLAAVFAMESQGLGSVASSDSMRRPHLGTPMSPAAWLAATSMAAVDDRDDEESIEIEFGGSLLIEPIEADVPRPDSSEEVWIRIEGEDVRIHEEDRDARIRCDLLDLRTGGGEGDRVDLLARTGEVEIDAPGLEMRAPAVRLRGQRVLVAGPGAMRLQSNRSADASATDAVATPVGESDEAVEIEWDDRLDLTISPDDDRLRRAMFDGGADGRVRVRSEALGLVAGSLDVSFLQDGPFAMEDDRIDRIAADRDVIAGRPDGSSRIEAARLLVEMRQDADAARPGRIEATGGVRAFDAERVLWASTLDAAMQPREDAGAGGSSSDRTDDLQSVEARGGVVAGLADGTWVFAESFAAEPPAGRLRLDGEDVAILRDGALLDGLRGLELEESGGRVAARTGGPGRLRASRTTLVEAWSAPGAEEIETWTWPAPPDRPELPNDLAVAAVWEGGLNYLESRDAAAPGVEIASLEVLDRVKARTIDETGTEDRLAADRLRVGFTRAEMDVPTDPPAPAIDSQAEDGTEFDSDLEIAAMDLDGNASLERRRSAEAEGAERPDLLRIAGARIAYVVATGEGRVPGAGTLLVSEAATTARPARTARFRWSERLDLARRTETETAVAISGDVELLFAAGGAGPAFTLTADRMDAVLEPRSPGAAEAVESEAPSELDRLELRSVAGAGRVFVRGQGRDAECDAFDYDAESGDLLLTARPGRSVSVMSTTAAAPVRASRVRWNLRTDRVEVVGTRGEG